MKADSEDRYESTFGMGLFLSVPGSEDVGADWGNGDDGNEQKNPAANTDWRSVRTGREKQVTGDSPLLVAPVPSGLERTHIGGTDWWHVCFLYVQSAVAAKQVARSGRWDCGKEQDG